jgi:hypothetical protein
MALPITNVRRWTAPKVEVYGENIAEGSTYQGSGWNVLPNQTYKAGPRTFRTENIQIFYESVIIRLTNMDGGQYDGDIEGFTKYRPSSLSWKASTFVGAPTASVDDRRADTSQDPIAEKSTMFYTLNGKDPVRTQSSPYTGQFTLYNNSAGCDSCIIKVKSYYNGRESVVAKAEFRIVYNDKARTFGK